MFIMMNVNNIIKKIIPQGPRRFFAYMYLEFIDLLWDFFMCVPLQIFRRFSMGLYVPGSRHSKHLMISRHVRLKGRKGIKLGDNVFINRNVMLDGRSGLEIGDNVDIGEYVKIWTLEHDPNDNSHKTRGRKTIIGDHVWIAPWSIIMPGVKIGRGAVIGGGSIVTKDIPDNAIVAGIPAKQIGVRNNPLTYKISNTIFL